MTIDDRCLHEALERASQLHLVDEGFLRYQQICR